MSRWPEFADRRRLARTVDSHHQYHEGAFRSLDDERPRDRPKLFDQFRAQRVEQRLRISKLFAFYPLGKRIHDALGRLDADIGAQQTVFERGENLVVDGLLAEQQIADPGRQLRYGS